MMNVKFETPEQDERGLTDEKGNQWTFAIAVQMAVNGVGPVLGKENLLKLIARMRIYFALIDDPDEGERYEQAAIDRVGMSTNIFPEMTQSQWERRQLRKWMKEYADRKDHQEPTSADTLEDIKASDPDLNEDYHRVIRRSSDAQVQSIR